MQTKLILSLLLLIGICSAEISYTVETRNLVARPDVGSNDQEFAQNMVQAIQNSASIPGAYCFQENPTFPLTNKSMCGTSVENNIGWIFTFNFADSEQANYQIQFGTDFGYGAAVYVDGVLQQVRKDDISWAGNWNSAAVFELLYEFTPGEHQVIIYGGEGCCDGPFDVRFQRNSSGFQSFNLDNLNNTIPEPQEPTANGFYEYSEEIYVEAETRYAESGLTGEGEAFGSKLVGQFNEAFQDPGYCTEQNPDFPLSNKSMCETSVQENIVWRIVWNFYVPYQSNWSFNFGTDFGRGYSLYLNGEYLQSSSADLSWAGDWDSSAVIIQQHSFAEGWNQLVLYGSEGCCDGAQDVRFSIDGGDWLQATQSNLGAVANMTKHNGQPFNEPINETRIIIESRYYTKNVPGSGEDFAKKLILAFEEAAPGTDGYCEFTEWTYPFTNVEQCGSNSDIAWRFVINFIVETPGQFVFQFGLGFGKGVVGYLDNEVQFLSNQNIWWDGNWDSPQIQQISTELSSGVHQIVVYGAENCCDGAQSIRFSAKGSSWYELTVPNLEIAGNDGGEQPGEPFYEPSQEIYVEVESRLGNRAVSGESLEQFTANLIGQFEYAQDAKGYCQVLDPEWPIENSSMCENGSNQDIVWRWIFNFYSPYNAVFDFQFGVDFGRGFVAYIDGQHSLSRSTDLWWSGNWNSRDVSTLDAQLAKGWYQIVIYGSEGCCDGQQAVRFRMNGGEWLDATEENFEYIATLKQPHDGSPYSNKLEGNQVIVESRQATGSPISSTGNQYFKDMINIFENADPETEGYCLFPEPVTYPFVNSEVCGSGGNIAWRWIFNFAVLSQSKWEFQFGIDQGYGAVAFLDGKPKLQNNQNLWWAGNWDSLDVQGFEAVVTSGTHQVVFYGYEDCCDGAQSVRVRVNGGEWFDATVENFNQYGQFIGGGNQEAHTDNNNDHVDSVIDLPDGDVNVAAFYSPCNDILANIESRFADSTVEGVEEEFATNLATQFETATGSSGKYCSTPDPVYPINNQSLCVLGVNENITWRFVYNFYVPYESDWTWEFGLDFGRGFALFVNGVYAQSTTDDLWWSGNWQSNAVQSLSAHYEQGWYQIVVYGSEGCCDGNQDVRFKVNNGEWIQATLENLRLIAQTQEAGIPYHIRYDATFVKIETRFSESDFTKEDLSDDDFAKTLVTEFDTSDPEYPGYCVFPEEFKYPLVNEKVCVSEEGPGSFYNILWRIVINFEADVDSKYEFRVGPDFERGVVVYLDGLLTYVSKESLFWAGDWESSAVFTFGGDYKANTFHQAVIYGSEQGEGKSVIQFRVDGGEWVNATAQNLENYSCKFTESHAVVVETRYSSEVVVSESAQEFGASLETLFEEAPAGGEGYCTVDNVTEWPFENATVCGAAQDIVTKFVAKFHSSHGAVWQFRFGSDFTRGAAVFIDSEFQYATHQALEWDQNWDSQYVFNVEKKLTMGEHTIRVYGLEGCCDGQFSAQFQYKNSGWQALTVANLERAQAAKQCVTIYSECDFKGESREVCNDIGDLDEFPVRSVYVPKRRSATLYNAKYWHGCTFKVTESLTCVQQLDYASDAGHGKHEDHVIQLVEMPEHERKKKHLRKN